MPKHPVWIVIIVAALAVVAAGRVEAQQQREPQPVRPVPVVVQPSVVRQVQPEYSTAALKARVAGDVHVAAIVRPDGTVDTAAVIKSPDPALGLDERALDAVRKWTFEPGTVDGKPAPFMVTLVLEFRIREKTETFPAAGHVDVRVVGLAPRGAAPSAAAVPLIAPQDPVRAYRAGAGVTLPVPVLTVSPRYPTQAMRAHSTGSVLLDVAVRADGTVGETRVLESLGALLDGAAVEAAKQWRFMPGVVDAKPVPVWVTIEMEFLIYEQGEVSVKPGRIVPDIVLPHLQPAPAGAQSRTSREQFARGAYSDATPGLTTPTAVETRPARYTFEAMRAKQVGVVELDVVVEPDGRVGRVRVAKGLSPSHGLDDQALNAVREWRFTPGTLDGKPVRVVTTVLVEFRLQ